MSLQTRTLTNPNFAVTCTQLDHPTNGMITCSAGDDGVLSYEDTCSFTCDTGYELSGSNTRSCQRDTSWSGIETECRGMEKYLNFRCHPIQFIRTYICRCF